MKKRILIIKTGALGDVVRTTPLLRRLEGEIVWVTAPDAAPLLPKESISSILTLDQAGQIAGQAFDLVLSLEEDPAAARLAVSVSAGELIGVYWKNGAVAYTPSSKAWFDMGLVSVFGKQKADELKKLNRRTYQDILFEMLGLRFQGEEYWISVESKSKRNQPPVIGIEDRSGPRWPMKTWPKYAELEAKLKQAGFRMAGFSQKPDIRDHARAIDACDLVVCGDTLTMHLALALRKPIVSIFICTSPHEIYGYDRMAKVVSPLLESVFYGKDFSPEPGEAVAIDEVFEKILRFAQ